MKKHIGFITGFLFGLLGVLIASRVGTPLNIILIPSLFLLGILVVMRHGLMYSSDLVFPTGVLLNGLLFGLIGSLIQKYLRAKNRNEYIVVYIFASITLLLILSSLFI